MLSPTSGDAELRLTESQSRTEFWLKSKERKTVGSPRADDSRPRHTWQVAAMNISSTVTATNGTNLLMENCRSSVSCRWEGFEHHETTGIFQNSQKQSNSFELWSVFGPNIGVVLRKCRLFDTFRGMDAVVPAWTYDYWLHWENVYLRGSKVLVFFHYIENNRSEIPTFPCLHSFFCLTFFPISSRLISHAVL